MASRLMQSMAYKRFPRRDKGSSVEEIELEEDKSTAEQVLQILLNVCIKPGVSARKKALYLSALYKLISSPSSGTSDLGLRVKEIMLCLRLPLISDDEELRTITMRIVRYLIKNNQDAVSVISVNIHVLINRILDLDSETRAERVQAVKLARTILIFGPSSFPLTLVKSLMALTQKVAKTKDSLRRGSLAVLCELSSLNPSLFISSGCVKFFSQILFDCENLPRIIESLVGCLLRIYNNPTLRQECQLDLSNIISPFTELHLHSELTPTDESRVACASTALLSLLRSWSGLLHISDPFLSTRPLQSLVEILQIQTHQARKISYETRKVVMDIIFKSLNLQVPDWTEEFDVAMRTADPSAPKDTWKLGEGFVAAEGEDILPHLSKSRPNLLENHMCVLLSCYLECKLPRALVQVIVSSDTVLSVRATVLLGQVLHLATLLLPHEIGSLSQCLPELADHIATNTQTFNKCESNRAISAVTSLQRLHTLKKQGIRPYSLLLEQALQSTGLNQGEGFVGDKLFIPAPSPSGAPPSQSTATSIELAVIASIKESQVLPNRDPQSWRWDIIMSVLRWPSDGLKKMEDSNFKNFIKKLTDYFKPSGNMFSRLELENSRTREHGRIGCCLLDFLISSTSYVTDVERRGVESESSVLLDDLLQDVFVYIEEVIGSNSPHDCRFSPTRLSNTACQLYFLFIGRLTATEQGRGFLEKQKALSQLLVLLTSRMDVYLKLIISSIDYRTADWRMLLSKALSGTSEAGRIYTIKWLRVLARIGAPSFAQYGVELLVEQLQGESLKVSATALAVLEEVCDDKMYLESLVAAKSSLLSEPGQKALVRLGGRGRILLTRFLGSGSGFNLMSSNNWLSGELVVWAKSFNLKYVILLEGIINDGFTEHQRDLFGHGGYGRRSGDGRTAKDVFVPSHLYGQLAQTRAGLDLLLEEKSFWEMIQTLREVENLSVSLTNESLEETWLKIKAAIWGLAHVATSPIGSAELEKEGVLNLLVNIAESCQVLTIKGTAYYALGLVATTRVGTNALGIRGWATVRHSRTETWPITYEWLGVTDNLFPDVSDANRFGDESPVPSESWPDETISCELQSYPERKQVLNDEEHRRRRVKTMSECTDSSLSQNMLELGPSPLEPGFPLPGKLSEKISSWFSTSGSGKNDMKSEGNRRFSDGGKSGSSFTSKLRNSLRKRSKTISTGSLPPSREGTPLSSVEQRADVSEDGSGIYKRRLSFSLKEPSAPGPAASPENLPGEIFSLENILEEPGASTAPQNRASSAPQSVTLAGSQNGPSSVLQPHITAAPQNGAVAAPQPRTFHKRTKMKSESEMECIDESFDPSTTSSGGQQMETSLTSNTSYQISDTSIKVPDINRSADIQITFSAQKFDTTPSSIRQGTSVSSVSSIGSFTFQDNYGQGSLVRSRIKRRPELSESEDGDTMLTQYPSVGRQDSYNSKTKSLDYRMIRGGGSRKGVSEPSNIPHKPAWIMSRFDNSKEPSYWGIAYPLFHQVLYPETEDRIPSPRSKLHGMVGAWLNTSTRHVPSNCLSCCRLRPSVRPRATSLTVSKDDPRSSILLSSSFPSSQQSPEVKRKSWNPTRETSNSNSNHDLDSDSSDIPLNYEDAKDEVMNFIYQLNSVFRYKQAEAGLSRFKGKLPALFEDLCFYSDVCHVLGEYNFRINARKFIQVLFNSLDISQMEAEARNILNPGDPS